MSPIPLQASAWTEIEDRARGHGLVLSAGRWVPISESTAHHWRDEQLRLLLTAAILQSYLRNTRQLRIEAINAIRHPDSITLTQLAVVHRNHCGVLGQSFEFAIADAVNAGVSEVIGPLRIALRELGVTSNEPIGVVLLGLEKVAPANRDVVYGMIRDQLPDQGVLRVQRRQGRPMSAATVLARIAEQDFRRLGAAERVLGGDMNSDVPFEAAVGSTGQLP